MFKLRFLFPIVALIAISDALPHTDEQLTQELEQAKQEQIKLARRIAKLERQAVALDAEQTSRETSGRNIRQKYRDYSWGNCSYQRESPLGVD